MDAKKSIQMNTANSVFAPTQVAARNVRKCDMCQSVVKRDFIIAIILKRQLYFSWTIYIVIKHSCEQCKDCHIMDKVFW